MNTQRKPIDVLINEANIKTLYKIGKAVCPSSYAVKYYYNKRHPKFHCNVDELKHCIRREASINHFNKAEIIREMLLAESAE